MNTVNSLTLCKSKETMAKQILAGDGYVLLPIECLEDVRNLRIETVVKPSAQEIMQIAIKRSKYLQYSVVNKNGVKKTNS